MGYSTRCVVSVRYLVQSARYSRVDVAEMEFGNMD
jgi:hypothetical protein